MKLIDNKEITKQSTCESYFEGKPSSDFSLGFTIGVSWAEWKLTPLFVEFKDWCDDEEHDIRLQNMNRHDRGAITTKELFDLWAERKIKQQ